VRAWARSRSFRDDEENSRLRRGLPAGAASSGCGADGTSPEGSRDAACSRMAAPPVLHCRHFRGRLVAAEQETGLPAVAGCSVVPVSDARRDTVVKPPRNILQLPTTVQIPSRIIRCMPLSHRRGSGYCRTESTRTPKTTVRKTANTSFF